MKALFVFALLFSVSAFSQDLKPGEEITAQLGPNYDKYFSCSIRKSYDGKVAVTMAPRASIGCQNPAALWSSKREVKNGFQTILSESTKDFPSFTSNFTCEAPKAVETTQSTCGVAIWLQHGSTSLVKNCQAKTQNPTSICVAIQVCQAAMLSTAEAIHAKWPGSAINDDVESAQGQLNTIWSRFGCK